MMIYTYTLLKGERVLLLLLVFLGLFTPGTHAQDNYRFRHLSTAEGLSQGSVISIAQDKHGLLWFATRDGLNRYDGNQFTVYRTDPNDSTTISNNDVLEILVDSRGDLWIGTYNGLNRYSYPEDRFYRYYNDKGDENSVANNSIWAIAELDNGEIWIGTGGGVTVYKDGNFSRIVHDPADASSLTGNYVVDIFQDHDGTVWVGTSRGLNKLISRQNGKSVFKRYVSNELDEFSLRDNFVQSIAQGPDGKLWFGTRGGLHLYDFNRDNFSCFRHNPEDPRTISNNDVRSLSFDRDGELWIGTYNGLNRMTSKGEFTQILNDPNLASSLSRNTIKSTFIDQKGTLWVGVYYGGINMLDETNNNFRNYRQLPTGNGLSYDVVSSIVEDKNGTIYVGTEGGGVNVIDPLSGRVRFLKTDGAGKKLSSSNIKSMYLAPDQNLWIGTFNTGIDIYNTRTDRFINHFDKENGLAHNSVYGILPEDENHFWIGTFGGGLHLLDVQRNTSVNILHNPADGRSLSDNQVRLLMKDASGNLWVGTQYGLNVLSAENIREKKFVFERYFYNEQKKSGEDILAIFEDSQNRIWVGTYESGISLFDSEKNSFTSYPIFNPAEGYSNVIHGILEDPMGRLWVSSNQGITSFNPQDGTVRTFDESDGLVSNEFNNKACFRSSTGMMYFGGPQGLSSFFPSEIRTNNYAPAAVITGLKLFNQPVKVGAADGVLEKSISETRELTLDYDQAIFSLDFAIPNFINPDKNLYAYRLVGLEENWNETYKNTATYTIQKPGTYTFEVRGANNDKVWASTVTSLKIKVLPAPWRTWWAFLIYFVIIVLALYLLQTFILAQSRLKHQLELEHMENERQKYVNQMKLRFFTNISHEFRTPLTLILGPLEQVLTDYRGSNKVYKQLKVMEKNAVRLLKLINQLMDFRKFENKHEKLQAAEGNIVKFVEEIYLSFKQYAKIHHIHYEFEKENEDIRVWYDRDKMERVFYNLISNAFKYTTEDGTIRVSARTREGIFEFRVSDTGVGIDPKHIEQIFERFYEVEESVPQLKHPEQRSTGIGLAIAKGVVEMHSGTIRVESEPGKGSEFIVSLPLGRDHLKEEQIIRDFKDSEDLTTYIKANQVVAELEGEISDEGLVISDEELEENAPLLLIVEDNASVRKFIVDIFRNDYRIEEASDGMEGYKKAVQAVPDLIISDVMMPRMDGIEFCSQIKSNLKTSHIPFILLSARTSLIFKFEGLESGADEYIGKPFNIKEIKLKARNLLNSHKVLREKFTKDSFIQPSEITVSSLDEKLLKRTLEIVDENISNEFFNIQLFSSELGVSRTMLFTKIKAWTNLTPNEFIHSMRMKRAAQLLEQNKISVSEVAYSVGFPNPKYFSKCFQKYHSATPSEYADRFAESHLETEKSG